MSRIKTGLITLMVILVFIQFVQPERNESLEVSTTGISSVIHVPDYVQAILQNSCYDCHSNNTRYPWYANIQPGAWWMASHIKTGKSELNFDEFGNYPKRRQISKLKAIASSVENKTMPLPSYLLIHKKAVLSNAEQRLIKNWADRARKQYL